MTNLEMIKSMTCEEFASLFDDFVAIRYPFKDEKFNCKDCQFNGCKYCFNQWLSEDVDLNIDVNDESITSIIRDKIKELKSSKIECINFSENKEQKENVVNHPKHYKRKGAIECIDEMVLLYGSYETAIFCKLNAHKYRYRAGQKENALEDLEKSDWYMNKYKELVGKTNGSLQINHINTPYNTTTEWWGDYKSTTVCNKPSTLCYDSLIEDDGK